LSPGAIGGIVTGVFVSLCVIIILFLLKLRRAKTDDHDDTEFLNENKTAEKSEIVPAANGRTRENANTTETGGRLNHPAEGIGGRLQFPNENIDTGGRLMPLEEPNTLPGTF
jgi:hypothetical protein